MNHPTGTIQSIQTGAQGPRAIVKVDARAACPRCAAGKGCGAGLFGDTGREATVEALIGSDMRLDPGDAVQLRLAPAGLLGAAATVYGLPLLGALVAAGVAWLLRLGDAAAAMLAIPGLLTGFLLGRARLKRVDCINDLVPTVEKKLHNVRN